jgi:hypothetical protein
MKRNKVNGLYVVLTILVLYAYLKNSGKLNVLKRMLTFDLSPDIMPKDSKEVKPFQPIPDSISPIGPLPKPSGNGTFTLPPMPKVKGLFGPIGGSQ